MTDVVTQTCVRCGYGILGTNFCENCGTRAAAYTASTADSPVSPATGTGPVAAAAPFVAGQSSATTALRVITLLFFLSTLLVPAIMSLLPPTDNEYALQNGVGATLEVFTGFLALLAAVAGRARGGARLGGALLALAYIALAMIGDFTGFFYSTTVTLELGGATVVLLLFLSWAVSRPFRGPGYFGLLVFIVLEFADALIVPAVYGAAGTAAQILIALIECAFVLVLIGLSAQFERSRPVTAANSAASSAGTVAFDGPTNGKARASLTMALVALGLNLISHLTAESIGLVVSIVALALLVAAIIVGHLARREIRATHQRGAGMALAGLLIGYIVLGIDVALLAATVLFVGAVVSLL